PRLRVRLPYKPRVFFFQAEDGIRGKLVTGVQTCALPILTLTLGSPIVSPISDEGKPCRPALAFRFSMPTTGEFPLVVECENSDQIGRASCRERVWISGGAVLAHDTIVHLV